ncbi:MAG: AAA family ATPase, partial [bacterium]|nr:AAA family ATPase [bacterium]
QRQKEHAEPQAGHFRLRGVAGSGKTQILAYRAAKLASQKKRVLILTFNITLWHYIRDMVRRAPFEFEWKDSFGAPYITFNHFHGFCKDILNHFAIKWPKGLGEDLFRTIIVNEVKNIIEKNKNRYEKWDAILIDEGQDYYWEWYDLLCNFLTSRDELFFVVDKKQNIYDRELSWIDSGMKNVKFSGRWRELKIVFRLPKKVVEYSNQFSKIFNLNSEIEAEEIIQPTLFDRPYDPHTIWREINPNEKNGRLWQAFEFLKNKKIAPSDIVILLPDKYIGRECVNYFEQRKISVNHVFEDEEESSYHKHKKAFWNGDGRLKMSTIHSFKGWECLNVIIYVPVKTKMSPDRLDKIIYTAITRTRENLIVYNANPRYKEFGKNLPKKWFEQ